MPRSRATWWALTTLLVTLVTMQGVLGSRRLLQDEGPSGGDEAGGEMGEGNMTTTNLTMGNVTMGANITYAMELWKLANLNVSNSTVFIPTNEAFEALPVNLMNITDLLNATYASNATNILDLHVVPGVYNASSFPPGNTTLPTLAGINITVDNEPAGVMIYVPGSEVTASVLQPDIQFGDNIAHIIDTVLLPFPTPNDVAIGAEAPNSTTTESPSPGP